MKHRTAITISVLIHASILIYLVLPTRATYKPPKQQYMTVNLTEPQEEQPQPPEPEPEKPQQELSEDTIQAIKTRVKPTPKPTKKPTNTPTAKPTNTPTKRPTKKPTNKPTPKPSNTPVPTETHTPKPTPTLAPSKTPTPPQEIVSFEDLLKTPPPSPTGKPAFNYGEMFPKVEGVSDEDKSTYGTKLSNHLSRHWRKPRTTPPESRDYTTIVSFVIDKKGNISNATILTDSGWALMDQTVLNALKNANPVPELPPTFPASSVQVRVPFVLQKR